MKVKLSINNAPFSGFVNIDPCPVYTEGNFNIIRLEPIVGVDKIEQSSCYELIADSVIDYIPNHLHNDFILELCTKIRKDGTLTISGTDTLTICRMFVEGSISLSEFNNKMYGGNTIWSKKSCSSELSEVIDIIKSSNSFIILNKQLFDDGKFFVKVQRCK